MAMKKQLVALILFLQSWLLAAQPGCTAGSRSVLFGERAAMMPPPAPNVVRVFMDRCGFYYPDLFISDKALEKKCSSLQEWYKANPRQLDSLCSRYGVDRLLPADEKINRLNDSVAQRYADMINGKLNRHPVVDILIHGFRKKAYGDAGMGSSYSTGDYRRFEESISGVAGNPVLFVEIYWDSRFITPLQSYKYRGFRLYERYAVPDAQNAGLQLRKLVPGIASDSINIITHSLGAMVGSELLFNATNGALAGEKVLHTPGQKKIRICMIEPAIGPDLFDHYYERNTAFDYKNDDNYRLGIVFNENDFVLLKSYDWRFIHIEASPLEYGNTALGCNYGQCLPKLQQLFAGRYPHSILASFDFSEVGADHRLLAYCRNKSFAEVLEFLQKG